MDAGKVTALTVLDLSATFDIIDHDNLLRRLDGWFGVTWEAFDWFESYLIGRCQRIMLGDWDCPQRLISPLESLKSQFRVLCYSPSIPLYWVAWSLDTLSLIIPMLTIAICMFPFHQGTLLQHWMLYSCVWSLSSHGSQWINWNWS